MKPGIVLMLVGFLLAPACGQAPATPVPMAEQSPDSTATLSVVVVPTDTPVATNTATPLPTDTPQPTPTDAPSATPTRTPLPTAAPTEVAWQIEHEGFLMVYVPIGSVTIGGSANDLLAECREFRSGCQLSWFRPSEPEHTVLISSFYIDAYEVTNVAYIEFLNALGTHESACLEEDCLDPELNDTAVEIGSDDGLYQVRTALRNHPVTGVTWYGAAAFCQWRGARLPTEAEWEKAASWHPETNRKTRYPWGNTFDGTAVNFCDVNCTERQADIDFDDGYARTAPVGSYPKGRSPVGAYDMAGNVWEWVADWFDPTYYANSSTLNPRGPQTGDERVVRGGSWFDTGNFTNSLFRAGVDPALFGDTIGFRCALDE